MILGNCSTINRICGHTHSGVTNPLSYYKHHTMLGYFTRDSEMVNETKRDSFPTATNAPNSILMGFKGGLISSTTTTSGMGLITSNMAMGRAVSASLSGSGTISGNLRLIIQLSCSLIGQGNLSSSAKGVIQMASSLAGSGNINGSLKLLAGLVSSFSGSGLISANLKSKANMSADITPFTELSPENLASAVWQALASEFNEAGTMGNKLNSAGSAGDPWSTILPGSYAGTQAGQILAEIKELSKKIKALTSAGL